MRWLLIPIALALDVGGVFFLPLEEPALALAAWLTLHTLACLCFLAGIPAVLPSGYRRLWRREWVFFAVIPFLLPVMGMGGVLLAVVPALHWPQRQREASLIVAKPPQLPYRSSDIDARPRLKPGALSALLRSSGSEAERVKAVLALRYLNDPKANRILREAMKDPVDDVRLLAYSILDQKEAGIRQAIQRTRKLLDSGMATTVSNGLKQLAAWHWALVQQELVRGRLAESQAQEAIGFIDRVLAEEPDAEMLQLKGRILRWQGKLDDAGVCFSLAIAAGMPVDVMLADQMELSFLQRDFVRLVTLAREVSGQDYRPPGLSRTLEHWRAEDRRLSAETLAAE